MTHRFLFSAFYINETLGEIFQFHHGTFGFHEKNISLPLLDSIKSMTLNDLTSKYPADIIRDYNIISLSYLGEMSDEEFNR
ncbi:hypothetical protein ODQ17_05315 [Acinetobacter sp. IRS14]|uniref:hypothetical protein n=1 Tax=Acinetobacter sp. IRS14 TaxID=2983398 RepID=UPI002B002688|nr:hypothetical protein [Acinetobacter sp. IRS14]MEA1228776.1 hypothetical protein [Acinetobacter sp. IRS14]